MSACTGKEPKPEITEPPAPEEPEKTPRMNPAILLVVLLAMGGIGAVIYLKFIKKKPQAATHDPDDYEYDDGEEIPDEEEIEIKDEESEEPDTDGGRYRGKRGPKGMTRFTDSPYERMMTRRPEGGKGHFPSSLFISRPPLLWLRELRSALRGTLPTMRWNAGSKKGGKTNHETGNR